MHSLGEYRPGARAAGAGAAGIFQRTATLESRVGEPTRPGSRSREANSNRGALDETRLWPSIGEKTINFSRSGPCQKTVEGEPPRKKLLGRQTSLKKVASDRPSSNHFNFNDLVPQAIAATSRITVANVVARAALRRSRWTLSGGDSLLQSRTAFRNFARAHDSREGDFRPPPRRAYLTCSARTAYSLESENRQGLSWFRAARGAKT